MSFSFLQPVIIRRAEFVDERSGLLFLTKHGLNRWFGGIYFGFIDDECIFPLSLGRMEGICCIRSFWVSCCEKDDLTRLLGEASHITLLRFSSTERFPVSQAMKAVLVESYRTIIDFANLRTDLMGNSDCLFVVQYDAVIFNHFHKFCQISNGIRSVMVTLSCYTNIETLAGDNIPSNTLKTGCAIENSGENIRK